MELLLLLMSRQRNKWRLEAKWADRGGDKTDAKEIVDDAYYACNLMICLQMNSQICLPAKADWVVKVVEPVHVSISEAMGEIKTSITTRCK